MNKAQIQSGRIQVLPPADFLSPAPSGGEGRGEGVLRVTESSYPSRRSLLSPALSSLGGRRGSSPLVIRGEWPDAPKRSSELKAPGTFRLMCGFGTWRLELLLNVAL